MEVIRLADYLSDNTMDGVNPDIARAELEVILSDPRFKATERNRAFLKYIVEAAVTGQSYRIKGYSIAVDVIGRDANFDSNADPIVRIEATRLRQALETYYQSYGVDHALRIRLPRGKYVADFELRPMPEPNFKLVATYKDAPSLPLIGADPPSIPRFTLIEVMVIAAFACLAGASSVAPIQMLFR